MARAPRRITVSSSCQTAPPRLPLPGPRLIPLYDVGAGGVVCQVATAPVVPASRYTGAGVYVIADAGIARTVVCGSWRFNPTAIVVRSILTGAPLYVLSSSELEPRILGCVLRSFITKLPRR
jgi:hypothetical protein